jgi:hypothetical protein
LNALDNVHLGRPSNAFAMRGGGCASSKVLLVDVKDALNHRARVFVSCLSTVVWDG